MKRIGTLCTLLWLFTACEKDPSIDLSADTSTLSYLHSQFASEKVSEHVLLQAGNHPSFERETDDKEVHLLLYLPEGAHSYRYFENDSIQYPDSLKLYHQKDLSFETMTNGLTGRFLRDQPAGRKWARVSFQREDSLFISPPVIIREQGFATGTIEQIRVDVSSTGRCDFRWFKNANINSVQHLLLLEDRTGTAFCGVYTRTLNFFFYDLRNVTENLTPELYDPLLVLGETYRLTIASMDEQGWMRDYRSLEFVADTNEVMVFESK